MTLFTDIQHRTRDDAGCAVWRFSCCNGHPAMRKDGKTVLVRRAMAAKYQVDERHISRIRLNKCWKQFSNPFAGLAR